MPAFQVRYPAIVGRVPRVPLMRYSGDIRYESLVFLVVMNLFWVPN